MSDGEQQIDPKDDETVVASVCRYHIAYEKEENPGWPAGNALAALLIREVVFLNTNWNHDDWPDAAKRTLRVIVDCSDIFAWACADGEECKPEEFIDVYEHWEKDNTWGAAVWCMKKRNQMPQKPVENAIRKAGIWDLDALQLGKNTLNAYVRSHFAKDNGNTNVFDGEELANGPSS